ncbi:CGNR zinc finger domain-containing protein [Fodinicola acaciae]|uniref:CGNR zinc finger domain-containing protein n=1 Tax=Fodinicola acaciae TaxID=2681555 RepID=UPI0013D57D05|nr:ABATE domain-containing protein [Fodinicola acaciae]
MEREWVWYGGRLSIDFVNTRKQRYAAGRELLLSSADLDDWLATAGLRGHAPLAEATELREAIDAGVRSVVAHTAFPAATRKTINHWLARTEPPHLEMRAGAPVLRTHTGPLSRIALDAAELFGTDTRNRLRICAGSDCSGRFVDLSAGQRRRWCVMAVCGNRAKAAQHRRTKGST